jgi:hypothetical protein
VLVTNCMPGTYRVRRPFKLRFSEARSVGSLGLGALSKGYRAIVFGWTEVIATPRYLNFPS